MNTSLSRTEPLHETQVSHDKGRDAIKEHPSNNSSGKFTTKADVRSANWARSNLYDEEIINAYQKGLIPLMHPIYHDERPRDKSKELGDKGIYLRTYQPAKERAADVQSHYRQDYLESTPYTVAIKLERQRNENQELGPPLQYGIRTENERIARNLERNPVDLAISDNSMVFHPNWKAEDRKKWMNPKKGFDLALGSTSGSNSHNQSSQFIPLNSGDPYKGGFDEIGNIARKRTKKLEISPQVFCPSVKNSRYNSFNEYQSQSIRSQKSEQFFKNKAETLLKTYPKTLLVTLGQSNSNHHEKTISFKDDIKLDDSNRILEIKLKAPQFNQKLSEIPSLGMFATPRSDAAGATKNQFRLLSKVQTADGTFSTITDEKILTNQSKFKHLKPLNREEMVKYKVSQYFDQNSVF